MTPERWQQIDKLLDSALELEVSQRPAFLDQACAGDEELRREVEKLLGAHLRAGSFLGSPAAKVASPGAAPDLKPSLVGKQLGAYQIVSLLGAGGMGEVYRAQDTRLNRSVAIKVLPAHLSDDENLRQRFEREARAVSQLNHPHICMLHDIGRQDGIDFLVMEYLEGETLAQRLDKGRLPLKESLRYAVEMASALEEAHSHGIVHRDLKPGNVMLTKVGTKLLDFGLAKLVERALPRTFIDPEQGMVVPDTRTSDRKSLTMEGLIQGTVSHMSPEQAEGKKVDARSDIFSFGTVLYEMVTGEKAFQGDSTLSILSAILREEPRPASQLIRDLPLDLEPIIVRCLKKDPGYRFQTMAEARVALEELKEAVESKALITKAATARNRRRPLIWAAVPMGLVALAGVAVWFSRSTSQMPEAPLAVVPLTSYPGRERFPSFSPDGNQVAFCWDGEKGDNWDIYVKLIGSDPPYRLTTNPAMDLCPAWLPDGRWIAFLRNLPEGKAAVMLISPIGGPERKLAETACQERRFTSSPDGNWLVIVDKNSLKEPDGLFLLSIETGEKRRLTSPPAISTGDEDPAFSPDGRTLGFSRGAYDGASDLYLLALSEDLKPAGEPKQLTFDHRQALHPVWTMDGREIIFSCGTGGGRLNLCKVAVSRVGKPQRLAGFGEDSSDPAITHQGHRLAYARWSPGDVDIWRMEMPGSHPKANPPTKFISSTFTEEFPQYSPDGKKIAFHSTRSGKYEIWVCDSDGSSVQQLTSLGGTQPRWSPDSQHLVFQSSAEGQAEIYVVSVNGGKPQRLTFDPAADQNPSWSHDGRWIYFDSSRDGGGIWKVPAQGGEAALMNRNGWGPLESPDGKFLYYCHQGNPYSLWKVPLEGGEESQVLESLNSSGFDNYALVDEGIYFNQTPDPSSRSFIQFLSFATGRVKPIATIKGAIDEVSVSPDRRWILYTQSTQFGCDLMLVENFR